LAANAIALLLGVVKSRWKPLHWRRTHLRDQGWSEERIAEQEGATQVAVSYSLDSAGYASVREAERTLAATLQRQCLSTGLPSSPTLERGSARPDAGASGRVRGPSLALPARSAKRR